MVHHAGYVLPGVVAVSLGNGIHVVAQGVHDLPLDGTDAHGYTALAIYAHVQFILRQKSPVMRADELETICGIGVGRRRVPI